MISSATASSSFLGKDPSAQKEKKSHNKMGANQYKDRPLLDDPRVAEMLNNYHLKGITDNKVISKLLLEEHGVMLGERSVYRRKSMLGLWASKRTTQQLSDAVKRQLVAAQMAKDPTGKLGATVVKKGIFRDTGLHLTRDYIRAEMKKLDPVGHAARGPAHVKEKRRQKELEAEMAAAAAASTSTTQATMETGPGNGLSSQPRTPQSPQDADIQRTQQQQQQQLYTLSPNSFQGTHGQSSTSQRTSYLAQPSLHTPANVSPTYPQPGHYEAPSPSHHLHLQPLPLPVPLMTNNNSISSASTSPYHQRFPSIQQDHQDEDADYSDDYSDKGDHNPQSPARQPISALLQETRGLETLPPTFSQQTTQTLPTPTRRQPPPTTTNQMGHLIRCLQETAPKMQDLTRCIEALNLEDEELDPNSYDIVLRGMEASALLERQLSRVLSLARPRERHSGTSSVAGP